MKYIIDHDEIKRIWFDKGAHPKYHDFVKDKLKEEWPLLYNFIDKIASSPSSHDHP